MNHRTIISLATISTIVVGIGALTLNTYSGNHVPNYVLGTPSYSYTCASVHFGMDDNTLRGSATLTGGSIAVGTYNTSIGVVSGITMTEYSVSNQAVYMVDGSGLKFSSSSKNSTVTLTFDESVIGCDIYAVGWNKDAAYITINGDEDSKTRIASSSSVTGTGTVNVTYNKYHFDFDAANDLIITATKRVIIGDIALRIQN